MMKLFRILLMILFGGLLAIFLDCMVAGAQDPNPQSGFAPTVLLANPSLYLNFNDTTASFKEQISGQSFAGTSTVAPVGQWPINEGTGSTVHDTSGSGDNGTFYGTASGNLGYFEGSLTVPNGQTIAGDFNGTDNYVHIPTSPMSTASIFTYAGWVYLPSASLSGCIFSNGTSTSSGSGSSGVWIGVGSAAGYPGTGNYLNVLSSAVAWQQTGAAIGTGWHFIAVTRDGTTMRAYIDGTQTPTLTNATATPIAPSGGVWMGQATTNTSIQFPWFAGYESDWQMYNVALTLSQIQALYTTGSAPVSGGTITPRQPGFDSTLANNTSAEFAWNAWSAAPNNTLGSAMEWDTPWTMMVQVDRLNWSRTGPLTLASKGDVASATYWDLYLQMNGLNSQLCFSRHGATSSINGYVAGVGGLTCTNAGIDAMPNGFNYNIVVEDSGTGQTGDPTLAAHGGSSTPAITLYINGSSLLGGAQYAHTLSYQYGFGAVALSYSGGSGYANSTAFTSTGGGANCIVNGTMTASGGTPNGITFGLDVGCTSAPTINLTSPTGTGVTITATLVGGSMDSASYPLMVPGYVGGGTYYGFAGTNTTENPLYVDEFAVFPSDLNLTQIDGLFYWTKFYQGLLNVSNSTRPVYLIALDGCTDIGNAHIAQLLIRLHQLGYINLEGFVGSNFGNGEDYYDLSVPLYRQMLDAAGLANLAVGTVYSGTPPSSLAWCTAADATTYNASTPTASSAYQSATSIARAVFAKYPTTPVFIFNGSAPSNQWLSSFLQSSADSISSLTGKQLWDRDVANGGAMYWQGAPSCIPSAPPAPTPCSGSWTTYDATASQYVFANLDGMPTYQAGGTPMAYGGDLLYTRTAKDPEYLACAAVSGDCARAGWGEYLLTPLISSYFSGGVSVALSSSGATGYAASTYFSNNGTGGTKCNVQGIMTASGGVPNGLTTTTGTALPLTADGGMLVGLGSGCTSTPTLSFVSPTGTGASLTAYLVTVCGTGSVSGSTYSFSSATCSSQYYFPFTQWAMNGQTPVYTWFLNSLLDPPQNGRPMGGRRSTTRSGDTRQRRSGYRMCTTRRSKSMCNQGTTSASRAGDAMKGETTRKLFG
jgi:hypothetical protein